MKILPIDIVAGACNTAGQICLNGLPQTAADNSTVESILTIAIRIIAVLSVLFIVIGGVRYVLSQGDPSAITKAKSTIVYAVIGLVIAILAQAIVVFVIDGITG